MLALLASALLLQPILHEPVQVRVVAVGAEVEWELDGMTVAWTTSGQAATFFVDEGHHELWARSDSRGEWEAFARPEPDTASGAAYVPPWTARHGALPSDKGPPPWIAPLGLASLALAMVAWPRRRHAAPRPPVDEEALLSDPFTDPLAPPK